MSSVKDIVLELPEDISKNIYKDYLLFHVEKKPLCDKILNWILRHNDAHRICVTEDIKILMDKILDCEMSIKYLIDLDLDIKKSYDDHFIKKKKNFELMDFNSSFTYSILMYKYH